MRNKISWLVILLIALGLPLARVFVDLKRSATAGGPATTMPASRPAAEAIDVQTLITGKNLVGTGAAFPAQKPALAAQLDAMNKSTMQRIAAATLAGELQTPDAAIARLSSLGDDADAAAFTAKYTRGVPLPASIQERYGFFAKLADASGKADSDPVRTGVLAAGHRSLLVIGGMAAVLIVVGGIGFCLLIVGIILLALGKTRLKVEPPSSRAASVYVQGFTAYLLLLIAIPTAALLLVHHLYPSLKLPDWIQYAPLLMAVAVGFAWPFLCGLSWAQVREDWGLHAGRGVLVEPLAGIAGYLAGLPIVGAGFLVTLLLSRWSGADVAHPVINQLFAHPYLIFFLAVVFAPITEETFFRGAFLSHLRVTCNPWVAALISGVIFAAIHPQGWAAIPALGSIGFVLAMIRQWRRTLLASMTAHALNNAAALTFVMLIAR